ncbi:MAG: hypothetical protein ACLGH0_08260 [Thermoanaerobaculia bacterium]
MKRSIVVLVALSLLLAACATTTPGATGVITAVDANTITVSSNGTPTTYTLGRNTNIYNPSGVTAQRSYLTAGQRVMVWSDNGTAVRINIEP